MHDMIKRIENLEEKALSILECGEWNLASEEGGAIVDEIKDLADAKKNCWKACYYEEVVKAMKQAEEEPRYGERAGYDNWRYSSGRFAPTGKGHRTGYIAPLVDWDEPEPMRMGYSGNMRSSSKYGQTYDRYSDARRHYHDTKDPNAKMDMDNSAMEYMGDTIHTFREMWKDADPAMKKKMKMDLTNLVGEMTV